MTTDARNEKWSEWKSHDGKSVPLPDDSEFEYETRGGLELAAFGVASEYKNEFIHTGDRNDIIAYRYKIKEPESDMHPDLEWLARNVSEWDGDGMHPLIYKDDDGEDYCKPDALVRAFTKTQWQAARQQLGLDQPDVTEAEEEAWQAIERTSAVPYLESDNVNKPKHYQLRDGYEVYDLRQDLAAKAANGGATYDQYSDWDRAIEYIIRMWGKNRLEDAKKGRWYLDKLIGKLEANE